MQRADVQGPDERPAPPFVPDGWPLPVAPATERLRLEPLGPQHHERDHAAWSSSIDHIRATPGFRPEVWGGDAWPYPMPPEENLADLEQHAREFAAREAFAYTVLDPVTDDVIGCVYVDPDDGVEAGAMARCWVRATHADLDGELVATVRQWLATEWPFRTVRFPERD